MAQPERGFDGPPTRPRPGFGDASAALAQRERRQSRGHVGRVFDIQRFSIHDGPGIRTTVFLKGCPLACPWCHNPEGRSRGAQLRVIASRCIECGSCEVVCPLGLARQGVSPDPNRCLRCGACAAACPTGARQLIGRSCTVDDIVAEVERDRRFYDDSGGGVTFSGGEPFAQPAFLISCLEAMRAQSIHAVVDTSGFVSRRTLVRAARITDLFLFDLKVMDPDRHVALTGVPLATILHNLLSLDRMGAKIWIRMPFVPGYNDDEGNLHALGAFAAGLVSTPRLHLLPYHCLGAEKRIGLSLDDPMVGVVAPSKASFESAASILRGYGLDVRIGG